MIVMIFNLRPEEILDYWYHGVHDNVYRLGTALFFLPKVNKTWFFFYACSVVWTQALCRFFFSDFFLFIYMVLSDTSTVLVPVLQPCGRPVVNETGVGTFSHVFFGFSKGSVDDVLWSVGWWVWGSKMRSTSEEEVCFFFFFSHLPEGFCCSHALRNSRWLAAAPRYNECQELRLFFSF